MLGGACVFPSVYYYFLCFLDYCLDFGLFITAPEAVTTLSGWIGCGWIPPPRPPILLGWVFKFEFDWYPSFYENTSALLAEGVH